MRVLLSLLVASLMLSGCRKQTGGHIDLSGNSDALETDSTLLIRTDQYQGVVFTRNSAIPFTYIGDSLVTVKTLKLFMWNDSVRFRRATREEVEAFEHDFQSYWEEAKTESLAVANEKTYLPVTRTDFLGRQYIGYVDTTGRSHLFVNFFPLREQRPLRERGEEKPIFDWRSQPVIVDDGGPAYFDLRYDLQSGEIYNVRQNGPKWW